jgi:hypothetical protein
MTGGSLADVLQNNPDWWDNTANCCAVLDLVSAMVFTHGAGVAHREYCL